jgi:hypothetical protein
MEGGPAGVQLLVPDECVEAALRVFELHDWEGADRQR